MHCPPSKGQCASDPPLAPQGSKVQAETASTGFPGARSQRPRQCSGSGSLRGEGTRSGGDYVKASAHRPGRRSVTVYRCTVRYELTGRARASYVAKCGDYDRLRYSRCPDTGKMVRHPIRRAVFSLGRHLVPTGGRKGTGGGAGPPPPVSLATLLQTSRSDDLGGLLA
jgi:hypothetical protein